MAKDRKEKPAFKRKPKEQPEAEAEKKEEAPELPKSGKLPEVSVTAGNKLPVKEEVKPEAPEAATDMYVLSHDHFAEELVVDHDDGRIVLTKDAPVELNAEQLEVVRLSPAQRYCKKKSYEDELAKNRTRSEIQKIEAKLAILKKLELATG